MTAIVQEPHAVLRAVASPLSTTDITSAKTATIIKRMKSLLSKEEDGVAIAAPQIGESLRIFVVSQKTSKNFQDDMVFINPEIIRLGKKKAPLTEGCLSVRWKYGKVKRSLTATVRALNEQGHEFVMSGRGLLAQIFQHEVDHLNGILFIDKASDVREVPPEHA